MTDQETNWKTQHRRDAREDLKKLRRMKENNQTTIFNEYMDMVLTPVKVYVEHELAIAVNHKDISEGRFTTADIIDELLIKAYNEIETIDPEATLSSWLFQQADLMLEDIIVEEEFNKYFFKNIDDLTQVEWDAMNEDITRDGDGDLVMMEELDDISYPKYEYTLEDIFINNPETSIVNKIDKKRSKDFGKQNIARILRFFPHQMRSVYNLYTQHDMDIRSIAFAKRMPIESVKETIKKVQQSLRYLLDSQFGEQMSQVK